MGHHSRVADRRRRGGRGAVARQRRRLHDQHAGAGGADAVRDPDGVAVPADEEHRRGAGHGLSVVHFVRSVGRAGLCVSVQLLAID